MSAHLPPFFIAEQPTVEIEGGMIQVQLQSGQRAVVPRSAWRRFLETEIRRLDNYERAEISKVVEMRRQERETEKPAKPKRSTRRKS